MSKTKSLLNNEPREFFVRANCYGKECKIYLSFGRDAFEVDSAFIAPYPIISLSSAREALKNAQIDFDSASLIEKEMPVDEVSAYPPLWPESVIRAWASWPSRVRNELRKAGWSQRVCQRIVKTKEWKAWKETKDPVNLISINKIMPTMLSTQGGEWPRISLVIDEGEYVIGVKHEGLAEYHIAKSEIFEDGSLVIVNSVVKAGELACVIREAEDFQKGEFWKINPNDSDTSFIIGKLNTDEGVTLQSIVYPVSVSKSQARADCDNRSGTLVESTVEALQRSASGAARLPLTDRKRGWDASDAMSRVRVWSGAIEEPNAKYRSAFFYYDGENSDNFTACKLQFADIIDGKLVAVPRAIFAVAAVLQGARGGVNIPDSDKAKIRAKVASYYAKMRREFNDSSVVVPWA